MRYMMLLTGTNPSTPPPPPELYEAIMKLGEDATEAGVLLDTAGLLPSASGARVSLADGNLTVTDGPFTESKELIKLRPVRGPVQGGGGRVGLVRITGDVGAAEELAQDALVTACYPVLSAAARAALTLRLIGGLTTHEIAQAFLVPEPTIAQRIVRAKRTFPASCPPVTGRLLAAADGELVADGELAAVGGGLEPVAFRGHGRGAAG